MLLILGCVILGTFLYFQCGNHEDLDKKKEKPVSETCSVSRRIQPYLQETIQSLYEYLLETMVKIFKEDIQETSYENKDAEGSQETSKEAKVPEVSQEGLTEDESPKRAQGILEEDELPEDKKFISKDLSNEETLDKQLVRGEDEGCEKELEQNLQRVLQKKFPDTSRKVEDKKISHIVGTKEKIGETSANNSVTSKDKKLISKDLSNEETSDKQLVRGEDESCELEPIQNPQYVSQKFPDTSRTVEVKETSKIIGTKKKIGESSANKSLTLKEKKNMLRKLFYEGMLDQQPVHGEDQRFKQQHVQKLHGQQQVQNQQIVQNQQSVQKKQPVQNQQQVPETKFLQIPRRLRKLTTDYAACSSLSYPARDVWYTSKGAPKEEKKVSPTVLSQKSQSEHESISSPPQMTIQHNYSSRSYYARM